MGVARTVCPLDCPAHCGLLARVAEGRVLEVTGDPEHPLTRGTICGKAKRHVERMYDKDRILRPRLRQGSEWRDIEWDEAYDRISQALSSIREKYGSLSVLHHDSAGFEGVLSGLARRFCNAFGGVTVPKGSICLGSGIAAQTYDFGGPGMHDWRDLENSRCIVLWGRDPSNTNIHLIPHISSARQKGARLIVVNPTRTHMSKGGDLHLSPRPGTDGALALSMAKVIIDEHLTDEDFVSRHTWGYERYEDLVSAFTPEKAGRICDVPAGEIRKAAMMYGECKPSAILLGYGMQRYGNGGQTVRAIDALSAITGNIGIPGGGVSYAHAGWGGVLGNIDGREMALHERYIPWPQLGTALLEMDGPPIKGIVVTGSNPVNQLAHTRRVLEGFGRADFVLVVDFFMTSTAEVADLVLPAAALFEREDVVYNSWNPYISHAPQIVEPVREARADAEIFCTLAKVMGLRGFGPTRPHEYLEEALSPCAKYGITLERLKQGPMRHPRVGAVAWEERCFGTPTGRYELYSERAASDGVNPLPAYRPPREVPGRGGFPLCLMTPHHKRWLNSQFWNLDEGFRSLKVEMHGVAAAERGIIEGDTVVITTRRGRLRGVACLSEDLREDVVRVWQGGWYHLGAGVNVLTPEYEPDMGLGTPFYDCACEVERV